MSDKPANNVLVFPIERNVRPPQLQTMEEVNEHLELVRQFHIQETIEDIIPILYDQLEMYGFYPDQDDVQHLRVGALVVESIRAFLCEVKGIDHPLQIIAENMFEQDDNQDIIISDKVKITISSSTSNDQPVTVAE